MHYSESSTWPVRFEGQVVPTGEGSRLDTRMEISAKGLGRLLFPLFRRVMARQEKANMGHIKRVMEGGVPPRHGDDGR